MSDDHSDSDRCVYCDGSFCHHIGNVVITHHAIDQTQFTIAFMRVSRPDGIASRIEHEGPRSWRNVFVEPIWRDRKPAGSSHIDEELNPAHKLVTPDMTPTMTQEQ